MGRLWNWRWHYGRHHVLDYSILEIKAGKQSQDTVRTQIHSASWLFLKVKIWQQDCTSPGRKQQSITTLLSLEAEKGEKVLHETLGHFISLTTGIEKATIFNNSYKRNKIWFLYILIKCSITQCYLNFFQFNLNVRPKNISAWAGKLSIVRVHFARHGKRHLKPLRMCSEWSQTARGQPRAAGFWLALLSILISTGKAYMHTCDQTLTWNVFSTSILNTPKVAQCLSAQRFLETFFLGSVQLHFIKL